MLTAKGGDKFTKELLPAGSYQATCYSCIDLGTHESSKFFDDKGNPVRQRKVRLTFEVPSELRVFDVDKGEMPMVFGKEYTLSLSEKSYLKKDLESWRGKQFTVEELDGFDVKDVVGKSCILSIGTFVTDKGEFNQINGISPLMKGQKADKLINPKMIFDLDDFTIEGFNALPKFTREKISKSVEARENGYEFGDNFIMKPL